MSQQLSLWPKTAHILTVLIILTLKFIVLPSINHINVKYHFSLGFVNDTGNNVKKAIKETMLANQNAD